MGMKVGAMIGTIEIGVGSIGTGSMRGGGIDEDGAEVGAKEGSFA